MEMRTALGLAVVLVLSGVQIAVCQGGTDQSACSAACSASHVECRGSLCACQPGYKNVSNVCELDEVEFERYPEDGWYNNLLHPDWGAIDGDLLRRSRTAYSDGVYQPSGADRPNPFTVSDTAHGGAAGQASAGDRTAMLVFFGQQLVEEIMDAQRPGCPREYFNIRVPAGHQYNPDNKTDLEMPFLRTRHNQRTGFSPNNPRQQLNEITPYIDGNLMYGAGKAVADAVRAFKGGRLAAEDDSKDIKDSVPKANKIRLPFANPPSPRDHVLRPVNRFYLLGNPRGNENPFLLSFGILWFRYHNYWADRLSALHPDWHDERLFDEAKKRVIAQYQKLVFKDWLPVWLGADYNPADYSYRNGRLNPYNGYDPNVHPGISQEFQTAALRFGHTLVPSGVYTRENTDACTPTAAQIQRGPSTGHNVQGIRLCNSYWVSQESIENPGVDSIFLGMAFTKSEKEDRIIVSDLRGEVFGPLDWSRRDLAALNIQRGRDHGLPGYNDVRAAYGLGRKKTWRAIGDDIPNTSTAFKYDLMETLDRLQLLYGDTEAPDNLDVFTGGLLETTEGGPGELFRAVTIDQFLRIRHGDRFWYENTDNGMFTEADLQEIESTTLRDILVAVTNIPVSRLQDDVFKCSGNVSNCACTDPFNLERDGGQLENCTCLKHYDYFQGSEVSFAVSFAILGLCIPATVAVMMLMARQRQRSMEEQARSRTKGKAVDTETTFSASEWLGNQSGERNVVVELMAARKKVMVLSADRKTQLRMIDLRKQKQVVFRLATDRMLNVMSLKAPEETDLVLIFPSGGARTEGVSKLESFLREIQVSRTEDEVPTTLIYRQAESQDDRKALLEKFFRTVTLHVFKDAASDGLGDLDPETSAKIRNIKLTRSEFADAIGMQPSSIFVRNMFLMVDRSRDGFVSFDEFMNMFITFSKGTAKQKAQMLFNMYDIRQKGYLSRGDFDKMIRSMLDLADASIDNEQRVEQLIQTMFSEAGIRDKTSMSFDDFCKIFASKDHEHILQNATLGLAGAGRSAPRPQPNTMLERRATVVSRFRQENGAGARDLAQRKRQSRVTVRTQQVAYPQSTRAWRVHTFLRYVENHHLQIFWGTLYTLLLFGIFIERAYYYSVEREHAGLRRLAGFGVSVTRGAASAMMFTYASLVMTMARNTLTFFRETFLHRFIPFDSFHAMHKYIAAWALFFTIMHIIGHGVNLYHISTQASSDLNCYFREFFRATHVLASFHYWAWTTITGLTGIILTIIVIVMYVFAIEHSRRHLFQAFWNTHSLYIFLYIFLTLHGAGRLVQDPLWGYFFIGPVIVYTLDKLVSISRRKVEISVRSATLLPSGVTHLEFKRPLNFEYKSGQWVRIACLKLASNEYHPFTLTSAPHEETLSLHIRAVGPWTNNIRRIYDPSLYPNQPLPKLYLDGPFGEGHQDWYRFPVSVLVGGGIGVTPFASILKDLVLKAQLKQKFPCHKVYFLWVTRTQKHFEWMTDIIKEVEKGDMGRLVDVHIFITQFQQKFDLRTTMLYICEQHFQRIEDQSLFTGLRATTHFGRPEFCDFFRSLSDIHKEANQIGVFSCGPPAMTLNVEKACNVLNREVGPSFHHHFENF